MGKATKHFNVEELVPKSVYQAEGDSALSHISPKALEALENVREILGVPLTCNNWSTGGTRQYSGYRNPGCGVGAVNGMHYKGMAFDLISNRMGAKEMRQILEQNQDKLKYPIRVEKWSGTKDSAHEITWLHIDIGDTKGQKIYFFLA